MTFPLMKHLNTLTRTLALLCLCSAGAFAQSATCQRTEVIF